MLRVSYSCEAEKAAAVEVAKCHKINANVTHASYNTIGFNDIKDDKKRVDNAYYRAIHSIYNYVKNRDDFTYNPNTMLLDKPAYSPPGTKMAAAGLSSSVTKIGCAYKVCPSGDKFDHSVICFTEPKIDMSKKLPPLYEPGASCAYDAECTAEGYDKCDRYLMLCTTEDDEDGLGSWSGASSYSTVAAIGAVLAVALLERLF
uniref:SCP domain-containing protein n=1 Tax=Panagrellus redivivus TaxID=6233 RepID=A0A7E4VDB1_PANRE